jgi:DNA topoisomerase-1
MTSRDTQQPASEATLQAQEIAVATGLVYVNDADAGLKRARRGKGFIYLDADGAQVRDSGTLQRIRSLVIPPAYTDVWICKHPRGHLQATGRDARRRKQYRYHPEWRNVRDEGKFHRMIEFGERLPTLRRRLRKDLKLPGLSRDKVLAALVTLLEETLIRVGNEEYARTNKSFGLTTLRNKHVSFLKDGRAFFNFRGKSGQVQEVLLNDVQLSRIVRNCQQLPGQHLFQYVDDEGQRQPVDSALVNDYLKEAMGCTAESEGFTAKDFRTWGATLRAIALLACKPLPEPVSERALKSGIVEAVKQVAAELGNTPTVCRKSYINPVVFSAWREGALHEFTVSGSAPRKLEQLALKFLRTQERRARTENRHSAKRPRRQG